MIFISQQQLMRFLNSFNPVMLIHIFSKFIISASYRILSRMGVALVLVLDVAYKLVDLVVVRDIITYFTDEMEFYIMEAAILTNIQEGLSGCLRIVAVYISESRLGHTKVIILSTISFTLGLGLLYKSTAVIIGIVLLAVGKAGLEALLEPVLSHQLKVDEPKTNSNESRVRTRKSVWIKRVWNRKWWLVTTFSPAVVAFLLTFFYEWQWQKNLLIATSLMGSACFLFWCGICIYHRRELAGVGSGFSVIFRVIKAFILPRILGHPTSSNQHVNNDNDEDKFHLSPKINWLRGLDTVAIIESSTQSQEEQKNFGRIFPASEVQLVKHFLSIIPMWTTILVVGLVLSTGNTFFPKQGNDMKYLDQFSKTAIQAGIWGGIVSSILCSSVGWQVEHRRLTIIGLSDTDPDYGNKTIPMSIFWLSPQFFLLGLTEGFIVTGLDEFTVDQFQDPWKEYVSEINEFVIGLGNFLSILFFQANKSLFRDTLNDSRLDMYYHRITIVSYVNMLFFFFIIYIFYGSRYQNISGETSRWLKRREEQRKFSKKVEGLISSLPSKRCESIQHQNSHWQLLKTPTIRRRLLKESTE
ncbi:protein NRT1/ PTR FAMILY 5.5-like [Pistacia vera]|uniref:protein NRT1/ PTR FAMILY 5.5-like n=1 Tax=Pistacia vera TaxID=55513 RepID=UPI0012633212|nr:protein NRT1/ PTR FAMILY 5.5-like [Pistacia vera]